jgi:hypothetical protein
LIFSTSFVSPPRTFALTGFFVVITWISTFYVVQVVANALTLWWVGISRDDMLVGWAFDFGLT